MANHSRAGQPAQQRDLINVAQLTAQYYVLKPVVGNAEHAVKFGTSGHRGSAARHSFNEPHILAIAQAIAEERAKNGVTGPCYVGKDTHALSEPAFISVLEVLAANGVDVIVQENNGFTPTPAVSNAILVHNKKGGAQADGIVITPSHNPPEDGGIKYNPPNGGPADTNVTKVVEDRANALLANGLNGVKRISLDEAMASGHVKEQDLVQPFVEGLADIVDMAAIQKAGLKLGVDPLGGSGIEYWKRIADHYKLDLTIVNDHVDQTFRFMHLDKDGAIRMDCSSECAMAGLLALRDKFDLAFANDPDYDRHGIVTPAGLMNPNHYLAVAINYLFQHRPQWGKEVAVGKTLVSSAMIDRVVDALGLLTVCTTAASALVVKRARGHPSCASTAPHGQPIKTASSCACWRRKSPRLPVRTRRNITTTWQHALVRQAITVFRLARPLLRKPLCPNSLRRWSAQAPWQVTRSPRV